MLSVVLLLLYTKYRHLLGLDITLRLAQYQAGSLEKTGASHVNPVLSDSDQISDKYL